ncbi:MAG TPA: phosphate ABC transporter substrate-binding protein PstS [Candidatus Eisenbacteria bacterium]|nr:phosphate ABC transporter substrate-binding protein PstS [Candidatus Eisenbacteria bacterium]
MRAISKEVLVQRTRWFVYAAGLLLAVSLAHCGRSGSNAGAPGGGVVQAPGAAAGGGGAGLTGAGATFPYPIYSRWFDAWRKKTGVAINYQSIGSGAGIQQLAAGTVDFGASDAPLSDDKLKTMPHPVLHLPTVGGAVVLAFNLPGVPAVKLTPQAIAGIFLGTIRIWNDPAIASANAGVTLPNTPILAVHRSDGSGTTNIFTTYLSAVSPAWKSKVGANTSVSWPTGVGGKGNDGVSGLVKQTPGAIGYVELAYARQNQLAMASIRNRAGQFVTPTLQSTTAAIAASSAALAKDVRTPIVDAAGAQSYPIAAVTFLLVNQDQTDAGKARKFVDFVRWAIHDGQAQVEALDYAQLPPNLVQQDEATLKKITVNGQALPAT